MNSDGLLERLLAVIPGDSVGRYDLLPVFMDTKLFADIVKYLSLPYVGNIDYVAAPEAIGWVLGNAMANELNVGFIPVRRGGKLPYPKEVIISQSYVDYSGDEKVLEIKKSYAHSRNRILIVDEWVETGASLRCCMDLFKQLGCTVVGLATIRLDCNDVTKEWIDTGFIRYIGKDI